MYYTYIIKHFILRIYNTHFTAYIVGYIRRISFNAHLILVQTSASAGQPYLKKKCKPLNIKFSNNTIFFSTVHLIFRYLESAISYIINYHYLISFFKTPAVFIFIFILCIQTFLALT